jgi:hypothetical protein
LARKNKLHWIANLSNVPMKELEFIGCFYGVRCWGTEEKTRRVRNAISEEAAGSSAALDEAS